MEIIKIGKYHIVSGYTNLTVLIVNDDGEVREFQEAELEKKIDKFFRKNL